MKAHLITLSVCSLFLIGCQTTGPQFDARKETQAKLTEVTNLKSVAPSKRLDPSLYKYSEDVFTLGPGDVVDLEIAGDPTSHVTTTVGPDGKIYYNLLPGVDVWGLTLAQAKSVLEKNLSKYFRNKPQVALNLKSAESKKIWILGRVNNPGVYSLASPTTLLDAISQAGGPLSSNSTGVMEDLVDYEHSFVMRKGEVLPINFNGLLRGGDMSQNIYLRPDDFVYLPTASTKSVYVLGAVAQPRILRYSNQMSLISAVASAGGSVKYANLSQVAVVRGSLTDPKVAILDYDDVMKGKASDVLLSPGDMVYIPFRPLQSVEKYIDTILNTFARTVGANEGARVVDPTFAPVGASVGISGGQTATGVFVPNGSGGGTITIIPAR